MAKYWEVVTQCPVHKKNVYIRVDALDQKEAIQKVLGMTIDCPWGPIDAKGHKFVVGFRGGEKEILAVISLPWMPAQIVSSAPTLTPITPVPPTPLETFYYVDPDLAEKQISMIRWWER